MGLSFPTANPGLHAKSTCINVFSYEKTWCKPPPPPFYDSSVHHEHLLDAPKLADDPSPPLPPPPPKKQPPDTMQQWHTRISAQSPLSQRTQPLCGSAQHPSPTLWSVPPKTLRHWSIMSRMSAVTRLIAWELCSSPPSAGAATNTCLTFGGGRHFAKSEGMVWGGQALGGFHAAPSSEGREGFLDGRLGQPHFPIKQSAHESTTERSFCATIWCWHEKHHMLRTSCQNCCWVAWHTYCGTLHRQHVCGIHRAAHAQFPPERLSLNAPDTISLTCALPLLFR